MRGLLPHVNWVLAPVPLTIFRSNSNYGQNLLCSGLKCTPPIKTKFFTRHDSVTVVTCAKFCCDWLHIFKTRAPQIFVQFLIRSKYRLMGQAPDQFRLWLGAIRQLNRPKSTYVKLSIGPVLINFVEPFTLLSRAVLDFEKNLPKADFIEYNKRFEFKFIQNYVRDFIRFCGNSHVKMILYIKKFMLTYIISSWLNCWRTFKHVF